MNITPTSAAPKLVSDFDETSFYQTQSEFISIDERLRRANQCIKNFSNKKVTDREDQLEGVTVLHFCVDAKRITEARYFISTICKEKLIRMCIKPDQRSTIMLLELIIKVSIVQPVKDFMVLRFNC